MHKRFGTSCWPPFEKLGSLGNVREASINSGRQRPVRQIRIETYRLILKATEASNFFLPTTILHSCAGLTWALFPVRKCRHFAERRFWPRWYMITFSHTPVLGCIRLRYSHNLHTSRAVEVRETARPKTQGLQKAKECLPRSSLVGKQILPCTKSSSCP